MKNLIFLILYQLAYNLLKNKIIDVLVENKMDKSVKFFGRSEYMSSVILNGNHDDVGKIVKVKIISSNQNSLVGEKIKKSELRVA